MFIAIFKQTYDPKTQKGQITVIISPCRFTARTSGHGFYIPFAHHNHLEQIQDCFHHSPALFEAQQWSKFLLAGQQDVQIWHIRPMKSSTLACASDIQLLLNAARQILRSNTGPSQRMNKANSVAGGTGYTYPEETLELQNASPTPITYP